MSFDLQPTLTGKLITLRPLRPEDYDALFAAASDPLIWEQHPEPDRYQRQVFQRYWDTALESGGAFAVIERKTGRVIGSTRYHNLKPAESEVEIGWTFLARQYWGGEYNGEMKRLMLDHAFRFVTSVVFVIGEKNLRSQQAVKKIGAEYWKESGRRTPDGGKNLVFVIRRG